MGNYLTFIRLRQNFNEESAEQILSLTSHHFTKESSEESSLRRVQRMFRYKEDITYPHRHAG
jgi:hypothetical protein